VFLNNELTQCSRSGGNKDTPIFICKIRLETFTYTAPSDISYNVHSRTNIKRAISLETLSENGGWDNR